MKVVCQYYSNNVRLAAGVGALVDEPSFRFFCIDGNIVKNKAQFKVLSKTVTILVSYVSSETKKNLMAVLTSDPAYREKSGTYIDGDNLSRSNIYYTLATYLKGKYETSNNSFCLELGGENEVVTISAADGDNAHTVFVCNIRGVAGEVLVCGEDAIKKVLSECTDLRGFDYTIKTPECIRSVSVKKSRGEILREIARFLGRTLVLASFSEDGRMLEQYISSNGILEVCTKSDGTKSYKKISPIVLRSSAPFCVYLTTATVDDIAREQGRSLSRKN